ncbi:MAG: ABC transporter ATP-binding protein [Bacilli bacterium]|nr:ABC transporter ATP-binding protein [Bacilli bacterium]
MKLEIKNLTKKFKEIKVLDDVSLTLESGKIYGLVGRNGSGKSVLLKIICGFYYPTSGEVLLDGNNYIDKNEFPLNTRALIEKPNFLPDLTGYENLELLASIQNKIGKREILDILDKVHLKNEMNKKYGKYSLGMKQKLGIAQVLMEDPDFILLDEPFNGVEDSTVDEIRKLLLEEKKKGKLILIVTHIKEDINELCDVLYRINDGKVMEQ